MAVERDLVKEVKNLRKRCLELEEKSTKDEIRCWMLEIENKDLKKRNEELEGMISAVQRVVNVSTKGTRDVFHSEVRKRSTFDEDGGVVQSPFHENSNEIAKGKKGSGLNKCDDLSKSQSSSENNLQKTNLEHTDEEHMDEFRVQSMTTRSAKRKRDTKTIASGDDEDSYDDDAPICTLKTQHSSHVSTDPAEEVKETTGTRYLRRLRKSESKKEHDETTYDLNKSFSSSEDEEDNEGIDESESLCDFIDDGSESDLNCESESSDESENALNEYKSTLDKIGRRNATNLKWDLEGDMLSDFGKDRELCMSAVCALYRQQTDDEKASKETRYRNRRGFSQVDAPRGSMLAQFLTDGDPNGDLNTTVEELKEYDPKGIKLCRELADKYSKQLFKIYQNKEDPYFPPQR